MSVQINHAVIAARDRHVSASFFAHLFGLPAPSTRGPFTSVTLGEGVHLQFAEPGLDDIQPQHLAFLVDEGRFDDICARLVEGGAEHWADRLRTLPGQVNRNHGGRGVYFKDPAGHGFEVTRPYGSPAS